MSNEHNPIAQRINYLQDFWMEQRALKPNAQFIRWLIDEADLPLVNGFYKLESSPHGKIQETLVVMLTDFEDLNTFSYGLAKDWLIAFKKDAEKYSALQWKAFNGLETKFKDLSKTNTLLADVFLVELLTQFKTFEGQPTIMYLGINPRKVTSHNALCVWICHIIKQLPENIGIVVTDYKKGEYFEPVFSNEKAHFVKQSLRLKDQDMAGAYAKLMTQGNPNDPKVAFRKCMLKMGEATKAQNKEGLIKWGEKGLSITKNTNDLAFWASAHLIYAGFLFGFKDTERLKNLLDKGITISEKAPDDQNLQGVVLQLYGYKAAYYSFIGKRELAKDWFVMQAQLAKQYQQHLVALTAYKNALIVLQQKRETAKIEELAPEAYEFCASIDDAILKTTEFPYIAKNYIDVLRESNTKEDNKKAEEVDQYLTKLFDKNWEVIGEDLIKKIEAIEEEIITPIN